MLNVELESAKLSAIQEAAVYLERVAEAYENWDSVFCDDLESVIYLRSRECECDQVIHQIRKQWQEAAAQAGTVKAQSDWSPFWTYEWHGEYSRDATVLRAASWCEIGGLDKWWRELGKRTLMDLAKGGTETCTFLSSWLFNMCRADLALTKIGEALQQTLDCLLNCNAPRPWSDKRWIENDDGESLVKTNNYTFAGELAFCVYRLEQSAGQEYKREALDLLLQHQLPDGSWAYDSYFSEGDLYSTAVWGACTEPYEAVRVATGRGTRGPVVMGSAIG